MNLPAVELSVNKHSENRALANEFMRFLLAAPELNNLSKIKRLVTVSTDYSFDEVYSAFATAQSICLEHVGIMDNAIKQMRTAVWLVANGMMTADEAMQGFGSLPED